MWRLAFVALLSLTLTGCIQHHTLIKLKTDGSGTIEESTLLSKQALAMAAQQGGNSPEMTEEKAKERAKKLGAEFVSLADASAGEYTGKKAVYSFADISKLNMEEMGNPGEMKPAGMPDAPKSDKPKTKITFGKSASGNALLTVVSPPPDKPAEPKAAAPKKEKDPQEEAMMEMMKPMFKGARVSFAVEVDGKIVKTNCPHVEGNKVTLIELPIDAMLEKKEVFEKMQEDPNGDPAVIAKMLEGIPGAKINPSREFTLEFSK
jgi:hypothetical protein